jgi:hypothetical protein
MGCLMMNFIHTRIKNLFISIKINLIYFKCSKEEFTLFGKMNVIGKICF